MDHKKKKLEAFEQLLFEAKNIGLLYEYTAEELEEFYEKISTLTPEQLDKLLITHTRYGTKNVQIYEMLVEAGANIKEVANECFVNSCRFNNIPILIYFIECGANPHADDGKALRKACEWNSPKTVEFLLEQGLEVTEEVIIASLYYINIHTIKMLLQNGADPNSTLKHLLLKMAKEDNFLSTLQLINKFNPDYDMVIGKMIPENDPIEIEEENDEDPNY